MAWLGEDEDAPGGAAAGGAAAAPSGSGKEAVTSALEDEDGLDWLKEASLLDDSGAAGAVDVSGGDLGVDDEDVPDWLKD